MDEGRKWPPTKLGKSPILYAAIAIAASS